MLYTELRIYNISQELSKEIFWITKKIPYYWKNRDVDQIRRSSASVPANIAEGYSRRFYARDFIRYLIIALGSSDETQVHIKSLFDKEYLSLADFNTFSNRYKNLSIKILNYINFLKKKHKIKI